MRRDRFHGVVGSEEIEFVGGPFALYTHRHLPPGNLAGPAGVLVCPPLLHDSEADYLRAVRLGRALAEQGLTVQRFHYRGTRYSDGQAERVTFADLVEDVRLVAAHLRDRHGVERLGLVGFRLGSLVAAAAARDCDVSALALWQPVIEPHRHVEDLVAGHEDRTALLGSPLVQDLLGSPRVTNLVDMVGHGVGRVQLVQLAQAAEVAPHLQQAAARWRARGMVVDVVLDPSEDSEGVPVDGVSSDIAVSGTAEWLRAHLTGDAGAR